MGRLQKEAEALSQNPSYGNIIGVIEKIAKAVDELTVDNVSVPEFVSSTFATDDVVKTKPKRRKRKK